MKVKNRIYKTPEESFAARTVRQGSCLVWVGALNGNGYGVISVEDKLVGAHRYAYERFVSEIPNGLFVDHRCHNRACVEPEHLRLATNKQNMENPAARRSDNSSGFTGVSWSKALNRWRVVLRSNGKQHYGGVFLEYELHVAAYYARLLRNKHFTHNDRDR